MPCIRGIEVSLIQGIDPGHSRDPICPDSDDRRLPEFPHPDSSYIRLSPRPDASQNSIAAVEDSHLRKTNSRISVYVPSEQGLRFALEWHIKRPEEYSHYIYFVVLFNGRRMVSWGADPNKVDRGVTEYALYEQDTKRNCSGTGSLTKYKGMEKRYFYFFSEDGAQPANDGGLIEVQVFRAQGRRLRGPAPPEYRGQENYGIMCPSGGLVESVQDLSYYDWHLHDRIDDPFITFRFYYRSLESLRYLSIVPPNYRMPGLSTPRSLYFENRDIFAGETPDPGPVEYPDIISQYIFGSPTHASEGRQSRSNPVTPGIQSPPTLFPLRPTEAQQLPQPSKSARDAPSDEGPERPLPMLPDSLSQSSSAGSLGGSSSIRSRASTGASVTPSLWDYVNDLSTDLEDAEICDARMLLIQRIDCELDKMAAPAAGDFPVRVDSMRWDAAVLPDTSRGLRSRDPPRSASSSDYRASPPSSESSQISFFPDPVEPRGRSSQGMESGGASLATSNSQRRHLGPLANGPVTNIIPVFIPEGQWIKPGTGRRTPSPLRRRQTQTGLNQLAADQQCSQGDGNVLEDARGI